MVVIKLIKFYFIIFSLYSLANIIYCQENYRCGADDLEIKPKADEGIPPKLLRNKLDSEEFKDFKIYFDPTNLVKDLKKYNLTHYQNLFIDSIQKVIETLQKLLKIKPLKREHLVTLDSLSFAGIEIWDTEKFGNESFIINSSGYDLIIFGRMADLGSSTLASAGAWDYEENGRPYTGRVNINNKFS